MEGEIGYENEFFQQLQDGFHDVCDVRHHVPYHAKNQSWPMLPFAVTCVSAKIRKESRQAKSLPAFLSLLGKQRADAKNANEEMA